MLRFAFLTSALAWLSACEPPDNVPIPATAELRAIQGTSWLVRRVTLSEPENGQAAGYDVDHLDSGRGGDPAGNCEEYTPDFRSALDRGITGVDNASATLIPTGEAFADASLQDSLDSAMREGRVRWALRIGELDEDETSIALELLVVHEAEILSRDSAGALLPGQLLVARRIAETTATVRRTVAWGHAETEELTIAGELLLLPIDELRVSAFGIQAASSPTELRGNIGGSFSIASIAEVAARDVDYDVVTVRQFVESFADLVPSAADPLTCERVSVGFGFEAVRAELVTE